MDGLEKRTSLSHAATLTPYLAVVQLTISTELVRLLESAVEVYVDKGWNTEFNRQDTG